MTQDKFVHEFKVTKYKMRDKLHNKDKTECYRIMIKAECLYGIRMNYIKPKSKYYSWQKLYSPGVFVTEDPAYTYPSGFYKNRMNQELMTLKQFCNELGISYNRRTKTVFEELDQSVIRQKSTAKRHANVRV